MGSGRPDDFYEKMLYWPSYCSSCFIAIGTMIVNNGMAFFPMLLVMELLRE